MIDIHHHCLPGVDDGPREMAEAVEMCAMAAEEGIEVVVATPHVLRGRWRTLTRAELESRLDELRAHAPKTPRLILGSEYFFSHDMADELRAGTAIVPLAGSRYVLVELASSTIPPMIEQPFYVAQLDGWTPVLAHPERNSALQRNPDLLQDLVEHGARVQITATSLTGHFGRAAQRAAETFVRRGLVHFVASDAHGIARRPPRVREALDALRSIAGAETASALTVSNPLAVVESRPLPFEPDPQPGSSHGLLTRLRSFFFTGRA